MDMWHFKPSPAHMGKFWIPLPSEAPLNPIYQQKQRYTLSVVSWAMEICLFSHSLFPPHVTLEHVLRGYMSELHITF